MGPTETDKGEHWKPLTLDVAFYETMLNHPDVSEEQRQEFIETIWNIVVQFVDLGIGIHPLFQTDTCEKDESVLALRSLVDEFNKTDLPTKMEDNEEGLNV